jgi:hypothetical protein
MLICLRNGFLLGYYENGNEGSGSIKYGKIFTGKLTVTF